MRPRASPEPLRWSRRGGVPLRCATAAASVDTRALSPRSRLGHRRPKRKKVTRVSAVCGNYQRVPGAVCAPTMKTLKSGLAPTWKKGPQSCRARARRKCEIYEAGLFVADRRGSAKRVFRGNHVFSSAVRKHTHHWGPEGSFFSTFPLRARRGQKWCPGGRFFLFQRRSPRDLALRRRFLLHLSTHSFDLDVVST